MRLISLESIKTSKFDVNNKLKQNFSPFSTYLATVANATWLVNATEYRLKRKGKI